MSVFITRTQSSSETVKPLINYLLTQGIPSFEADEALFQSAGAQYGNLVNDALLKADHLIIVGNSIDEITSEWTRSHWGQFLQSKKSSGKVISLISANVATETLPSALKSFDIVQNNEQNYPYLVSLLKEPAPVYQPSAQTQAPSIATPAPISAPGPTSNVARQKAVPGWLIPAGIALLLTVAGYFIFFGKTSVDLQVAPSAFVRANAAYPVFASGTVVINLDGSERIAAVTAGSKVLLTDVPKSALGKKFPAKLIAPYWKVESDEVLISENTVVSIIPDGTLGNIVGNVIDQNGVPLTNAQILIGNDTTVLSDNRGGFRLKLPAQYQKRSYAVTVSKPGYAVLSENIQPNLPATLRLQRGNSGSHIIINNEKESLKDFIIKESIKEGIRSGPRPYRLRPY